MDPRIEKPWISNLKFILVAGGGLFADGYLNFTIGLGR
jgi:PHS family inorganic phosphate transporter-like MFS transporter